MGNFMELSDRRWKFGAGHQDTEYDQAVWQAHSCKQGRFRHVQFTSPSEFASHMKS